MLLQLAESLLGGDPSPSPLPAGSSSPPFFNSTGWEVFAAVALVIGLLAAIQQFSYHVRRRADRRVEARVFALVEAQLRTEDIKEDAESAEQDAQRLEARVQELLRQIHDQIPRQAQRLHLAHRRDQLAESLAVDFAEYSSLEAQLRSDSETPTSPLDASIRDAISTAVVPAWDQRRRQDRRVAALLSLLVLLYFLPLSLGEVVRWGLQVLMEPLNNYGPTVASVVAWGIFAVVLLMWGVDRATRGTSVRTRLAALKPARALYRRFAVVVVGFSGLASLLLAAVLYETLTYPYYHSQSEQAAVGTMLVLGILGVSAAVYVLARHVVIARKRTTSLREEQRP